MEVQDKPLLKAQGKEATKLFKHNYKNVKSKIESGSDPKINDTVHEAVKTYHKQLSNDHKNLKRQMLQDADSIYKQYITLMWLPVELAAMTSLEKTKIDQPALTNFIDNRFIKKIASNKTLENAYLKSGLSWENEVDELRIWLREILIKDAKYQEYLNLGSPDFETDKQLVQYLIKSLIFKHEDIEQFMENKDLYWSENKVILRSMVNKTLKNLMADDQDDFDLAELSYNWEDDKEFFELIFDKTLEEEDKYETIIAQKSENWDVDRISEIDKILLEMAIQEMINFPAIPIKVTINEYIEISKKYSTPKSKQFVNGVLDVIAVDLQEQGIIKKSGRGLIDNK